jgi:hypothetical protein
VDAAVIIARVARAIEAHGLEAILIGNAGAAMHGAPVMAVGMDFLIRRAPANRKKLKSIASDLGATLYRPIYPASRTVRLMNDDQTLQVDFMEEVSGLRSFEGVRKRAQLMRVAGREVRIAALADITKSADIVKNEGAADRPSDRAVHEILERYSKPSQPKIKTTRKQRLEMLRIQSDWLENDMIRRRVAAPLEHRMNFLRKRVGICQSCL